MTEISWKTFSNIIIFTAIVSVVMIICLNLIVDPYRVFNVFSTSNGYTPNERYNKVDYLLDHPARFDGLLLGSSKIGLFDPRLLTTTRPGINYYNLGVFGGDSKDATQMLKALLDNGLEIKEVVVGLDVGTFMGLRIPTTPAYKHHPVVSGEPDWLFFSHYMTLNSLLHSALKLIQSSSDQQEIQFNFEHGGHYQLSAWDKDIENNHEAYISEHFGRSVSEQDAHNVPWIDDRFDEVVELKKLLDRKGIRYSFFIHPHHPLGDIKQVSKASLKQLEVRLSAIIGGDLVSFLGREDMESDKLYYEPKHYRPILIRQVVKSLVFSR